MRVCANECWKISPEDAIAENMTDWLTEGCRMPGYAIWSQNSDFRIREIYCFFVLTKCLFQAVHKTFHNLLLLLSVFDMVRFRWKSRIQGLWRQFSSEFQIQFTQWRWQTPPKISTDSIWWKNLQIPIINFHFSEAFGLICIHIVPALKFISSFKYIPNII